MPHHAPVTFVRLSQHEPLAGEAVDNAGQRRRRHSQRLGQGAGGGPVIGPQQEEDPQLGDRQPQLHPGFQSAGIGAGHGAAQQVERTVPELLCSVGHISCIVCKYSI